MIEEESSHSVIYARVSTGKDTQNPETQLLPCKRYCAERGYQIIDTYIDRTSGRNFKRSQYQRMMKDALYHRFDKIVVFKMDRLSRGKIREVLNVLEKLRGYGVTVESVTEPFLNTDNPSWDLILSIMAWCANMESQRISERVTAGISRWEKEHNKRWKSKEWDRELAIKLRQQGMGWRSIEKEMRRLGYDITYQGIRKELLNQGFSKGENLPGVKQPDRNATDKKVG